MRKARVSWHIPGQRRQTFKLGSQRTLPRLIKVCTIPWGLDKSGQLTLQAGEGQELGREGICPQTGDRAGKAAPWQEWGKKNPIFEAIFKALRWTQTTAIGKGTFLPQLSSFSP